MSVLTSGRPCVRSQYRLPFFDGGRLPKLVRNLSDILRRFNDVRADPPNSLGWKPLVIIRLGHMARHLLLGTQGYGARGGDSVKIGRRIGTRSHRDILVSVCVEAAAPPRRADMRWMTCSRLGALPGRGIDAQTGLGRHRWIFTAAFKTRRGVASR